MANQVSGSFTVDFSQVPDREAAPAGEYQLEIVSAELRVSKGEKTAGTRMLNLHWKIVGGEADNTRVFENLMLAGDAMWKTKQFFVAAFGKGQTTFQMNCEELVGVQVRARLTTEVWEVEAGGDGETRNRVGRYLPHADESGAESLDDLF